MTSAVYWRWKSQKVRDSSTVSFEGTGISVWELKKDILAAIDLGKGDDWDFEIANEDTGLGTCQDFIS